jgi:hypothetical protein
MKQTSVEWLLQQMDLETISKYDKQLVKAKEMEKQQMLHFWQGGLLANELGGKNFETYYNETYKK